MNRYIDADWIIQKLERWRGQLAETYGENDEYVLCLGEVLMKLDDAPTADVRENVMGEWRTTYLDHVAMGERPKILYCSVCNQCIAYPTNYCPNCGAQMVRGEK